MSSLFFHLLNFLTAATIAGFSFIVALAGLRNEFRETFNFLQDGTDSGNSLKRLASVLCEARPTRGSLRKPVKPSFR